MTHQKDAVKSGYWPLYRFHPSEVEDGKPFKLDSDAAVDPDRRVRGHRDPLRRPPADPPGARRRARRRSPRPTPTSAGATTSSSPASSAPSPTCPTDPTSQPDVESDAGYRYDDEEDRA